MALFEKTAAELSKMLADKEISAVELAQDVFARTKAVEDKVQGYVTVAEESALAQAAEVDKKRAAGEELSALAVSYTHLDVYKRQEHHRTDMGPPVW